MDLTHRRDHFSGHMPVSELPALDRIGIDLLANRSVILPRTLDACTDAMHLLDLDGAVLQQNKVGRFTMGLGGSRLPGGLDWARLWPDARIRSAARQAIDRVREGKPARFSGPLTDDKGTTRYWRNVLTPVTNDRGDIIAILCASSDVTARRRTALRLQRASERDALTGAPNRRAFEARLSRVTRSPSSARSVGLVVLDLDHFKQVNDTLGHLAGNHLLKMVARRLKTSVPKGSTIARLGGDEFAIILRDIRDGSELEQIAASILARIQAPVTFAGKPVSFGVSAGCAIYPRDASTSSGLFGCADAALKELKAAGRGGVRIYGSRIVSAVRRAEAQLTLARRAILDDAVEPHFQPRVRLDTGEIAGFEALLRWRRPGADIQSPGAVAEAFTDYELASQIGDLMQQRVIAVVARWLKAGLKPPPVSINAAPIELLCDDFAGRLLGSLTKFGVPPGLIGIEISEQVLVGRAAERAALSLRRLHDAGIHIALDDFGAGPSSLALLRQIPIDIIKLDRALAAGMQADPSSRAMVRAIACFGAGLSIDIVAKGIETGEQLDMCRSAGCGFGQGFYLAGATDAESVAALLPLTQKHTPMTAEAVTRLSVSQ